MVKKVSKKKKPATKKPVSKKKLVTKKPATKKRTQGKAGAVSKKVRTPKKEKVVPNGTKGTGRHSGMIKVTGGWSFDTNRSDFMCKPGMEKILGSCVWS